MELVKQLDDNDLNLIPPEGHKEVGPKSYQVMLDQMEDKKNLNVVRKWKRNYKYSWNKYWNRKSTYKLPLVSGNLVYRHQQNTVTYLTDGNPTFNALATGGGEGVEDQVTKIQRAADDWWRKTEQQRKFAGSVRNGETYGPAIEGVDFDLEEDFGKGEVVTNLIDPFNFGCYPFNEIDNQKGDANFDYQFYPLHRVKQQYPDHADEIKADSVLADELGEDRKDIDSDADATAERLQSLGQNVNMDSASVKDKVLVLKMWVKDRTMVSERVVVTMLDGGQPQETPLPPQIKDADVPLELNQTIIERQKPKYPGYIRRIEVCNGGDLVLSDMPNPSINPNIPEDQAQLTYLYDKFPYTRVVSIDDNTNPWGMCDIEQVAELTFEFQKALSQIVRTKDTKARLKVVNPMDSGVPNSHFTNQEGIIRPSSSLQAQAIRFLDSPKTDQDQYEAANYFKDLFFLITGSFELENAQVAGGNSLAYKALELLSEKIQGLMRGKSRNYDRLIRERGRMYTSHVFNWYTEDRLFAYEEDGKTKQDTIRGGEGHIIPVQLTVINGSTFPKSKIQVREEAIQLYDKGALGKPVMAGGDGSAEKHLLKAMDYDGWTDIVEDIQGGVLKPIMNKLQAIGIPPQILQFFQQVLSMDDDALQKALEAGEIPPFKALVESLMQQGPTPQQQMQQLEMQAKQAEVQKMQAEAEFEKARAQREGAEAMKLGVEAEGVKSKIALDETERTLNIEKAKTEQAKQQQAMAGIRHDEEAMKMQKAEIAADIREKKEKKISGDFFKETGRSSNNKLT